MKRSPMMQHFVNQFANDMFGAAKAGHCPCCHEPIKGFKDELSKKEYTISGMCQSCQDKTFVEEANSPY